MSSSSARVRFASLALAASLAGCAGHGGERHEDFDRGPLDAGRAFARLQTLVGSYEATVDSTSGTTKVSYEVTSGGHALLEKISEGTDHAMVSMYFLEGSDLAMVHYCALGNRPHLRLDRLHSTIDDLRLEWDGGATDVDPTKDAHIHAARFHFKDPQTVETEWTFWKDGKEEHKTVFTLDRTAARSTSAPPQPAPPTSDKLPPIVPPTPPIK